MLVQLRRLGLGELRSRRRRDLDSQHGVSIEDVAWRHTESTKNRICKAITDRQLPLRRDNQTKRRDEEEIGNKGIRYSHTSPFHQTQ